MPLQVIGAGYGRTGTESLQAALEQLLGGKCYHMKEVFSQPEHARMWAEFADSGRRTMDWERVMADYTASVDWPACNYYAELLEQFPDAKVVLTVREPEAWFESQLVLVHLSTIIMHCAWFVPYFRPIRRMMRGAVWHNFTDRRDKRHCIEVFNAHIAEVKARVPADKLLVFRVQEGWGPLCAFLGVPVPDAPFPRKNNKGEIKKFGYMFIKAKVKDALIHYVAPRVALVAAVAVGAGLWWRNNNA